MKGNELLRNATAPCLLGHRRRRRRVYVENAGIFGQIRNPGAFVRSLPPSRVSRRLTTGRGPSGGRRVAYFVQGKFPVVIESALSKACLCVITQQEILLVLPRFLLLFYLVKLVECDLWSWPGGASRSADLGYLGQPLV